jgi:hypothetical protein
MGLLNLFNKPAPSLLRLPSGSFTVDREGSVVASTVPTSFPEELVAGITQQVLATFREAAAAQLPLEVLTITYPSLKIIAREMRGGALIFLAPQHA